MPGTVDGQRLRDIDVLATAVIAFARITLGVLVCQHGSLHGKNVLAGVVLRCDQLDVMLLANILRGDGGSELRIKGGQRIVGSQGSGRLGHE